MNERDEMVDGTNNLAAAREQKQVGKVNRWRDWRVWALLLVILLLLAGMLLPALNQPRDRRRNYCVSHLKQIGLASIIYAGDDIDYGYFPSGDSFERLHEGKYLKNGKVYTCDRATHPNVLASKSNYVYLGDGLRDTNGNPGQVILAHDRIGNHENWVNCLYMDGHVRGWQSSAKTWDEFRAEREADGDVLPKAPADGGMALGPEDEVLDVPR